MIPRLSITSVATLIKKIKQYGIDKEEGMDLTVGYHPKSKEWDYQTGDNSYTGACYHYPIWGVTTVFPKSNSRDLAEDVVNQIRNQVEAFA